MTSAAPRRPPSVFDRVARTIALLALVVILSVIYWIPFSLLESSFGGPLVMALLTLGVINLASRHHRLRQRVDALEEQAVTAPAVPVAPPPADQK